MSVWCDIKKSSQACNRGMNMKCSSVGGNNKKICYNGDHLRRKSYFDEQKYYSFGVICARFFFTEIGSSLSHKTIVFTNNNRPLTL